MIFISMKLKELLVKMYEGHCERQPDETDEAYLTRCGNNMFNQQFGISQLSNIPNVIKEKRYPSFADPLEGFPTEYKELLKKLQRSNNPDERTKLIDRMNIIRKNIKLKPLTNESVVNEGEGTINEDSETKRLEMLIKNLEETNKLLVQQLKDNKSLSNNKKENIKKSIYLNLDLINYYKKWLKDYQALANESDTHSTGERIQNLNNRINVLRDKISTTKSPEQKKLHSDRLKNALQSLSNIKRDHSIKK